LFFVNALQNCLNPDAKPVHPITKEIRNSNKNALSFPRLIFLTRLYADFNSLGNGANTFPHQKRVLGNHAHSWTVSAGDGSQATTVVPDFNGRMTFKQMMFPFPQLGFGLHCTVLEYSPNFVNRSRSAS